MKKVINLIFVCLLCACGTKNETPPPNLISKNKLANILSEIHQAESKVNNLGLFYNDTSYFLFRKFQTKILAKYEVDTSAYFQSYKYYLVNPEDFLDIYKDVVKQLAVINTRDSIITAKKLAKKPDSTKIKADSVPRINEIKKIDRKGLVNRKLKLGIIKAKN
jgi:hypothetical protein